MNAFILVGSDEKQKEYLNAFCAENSIQTFYKHEFPDFKIMDARSMVKLLSKKLHTSEKQIVIISNPTLEAQHAILKTIEELPESTYVFFLCVSRDNLLSTIQSRCKILSLDTLAHAQNKGLDEDLEMLVSSGINKSNVLFFAEKYGQDKEEIEKIVLALRTALLKNIDDKDKTKIIFEALQQIVLLLPLIKQNNIQPRFALESAFTSVLPS